MTSQKPHLEVMGSRIAGIEDQVLSKTQNLLDVKNQITFHPSVYERRVTPARVAAAAGLAAAAALVVMLVTPSPEMTVRVAGRALDTGDWISVGDNTQKTLEFSDGSRIRLYSKSGVRIQALASTGARLLLERGAVEAAVEHRDETDWRLEVGPYLITVTGTRFTVSWDPETETFSLDMKEGSVDITGPMLTKGKRVSSGERLLSYLASGRMELIARHHTPTSDRGAGELAVKTAAKETRATGSDSSATPTPGRAEAKSAPHAKLDNASGWLTLAEQGRYKEAVASAKRQGIETIIKKSSAPNLIALGDAARHAEEIRLASRVYQAARRRFPKSPHASSAAFALGIMAFDHKRAFAEAATWFRTIIAENPRKGTLAKEASGRLIEALSRAGDTDGARSIARQYLSRYPDGPHADLAKQLTE